jgi:hypothetical protein
MKCQRCDQPATLHVTDVVDGQAVDYHVCENHFQEIGSLPPATPSGNAPGDLGAFFNDPRLREALFDPAAREKVAAYLLPALCLALLDERPEVRVAAAFRLMTFGGDARSTLGALRDACHDPDERVRKAAEVAMQIIQNKPEFCWLL